MIIQNILDSVGTVIGTLSFPDGTDSGIVSAAVAQYTIATPPIPASSIIASNTFKQTSAVSTSASTPVALSGMSWTPPAGVYIVNFSGSINTNGASAVGTFGIYSNGTLVAETNRPISCNLSLLGGLVTISLNAIGVGTFTSTQLTLDGSTSIDVRFNSTNGGTIQFSERVLTFMKVG